MHAAWKGAGTNEGCGVPAGHWSHCHAAKAYITAVAAMTLVEDGLVALDDPVSKYIPVAANLRVATRHERNADGGFDTVPLASPLRVRHLLMFVSGIGGKSVRRQRRDDPWWASVYTSDQEGRPGALFGVFHCDGDPAKARFYFKDIDGRVVDAFTVRSGLPAGGAGD